MDLLDQLTGAPHNLLPEQGTVLYFGKIIATEAADRFFRRLREDVQWHNDELVVMGKKVITRRKVAWYADHAFSYTYTGATKTAQTWIPVLHELKDICEKATGHTFNSCLLNLYHDGSEGMGWHSDAETELEKHGAIASLSLGGERRFAFKHKRSKVQIAKFLEHGSLLVMKGVTQDHWLHRLPVTTSTCPARISLTFRTIKSASDDLAHG